MSVDDDLASLLAGGGVYKSKTSGSFDAFPQRLRPGVSHNDALAARVIANVVGVVRKFHASDRLKRRPIVDFRDAVQAAGDIEAIGGCVVIHPLWFGQIWDGPHTLVGLQINHLKSVISNSSHEQALTFHVDAEVID